MRNDLARGVTVGFFWQLSSLNLVHIFCEKDSCLSRSAIVLQVTINVLTRNQEISLIT